MKVLFVASYNKGKYAPFIEEQAASLRELGCEIDFFGISGKGIKGYLGNLTALRRKIHDFQPDVIHAHYGLSGLLANLQRKVPVVTTYHGSDINEKSVLPFSKLSIRLSAFNVFVSPATMSMVKPGRHSALIPCGISLEDCRQISKAEAREKMNLDAEKRYVLFAGAFDNWVKNADLAKAAMQLLPDAELLELKGYDRQQVTLLMNACDALLMTSHTEGSPQVVKEAMACGCPVVSVDVGDVRWVTEGVEGCHIPERTPDSIAACLAQVFQCNKRTDGRSKIIDLGLTDHIAAARLLDAYKSVL